MTGLRRQIIIQISYLKDFIGLKANVVLLSCFISLIKHHYFTDFSEVLGKKEVNGKHMYYIHYEDCEYIDIGTYFYHEL